MLTTSHKGGSVARSDNGHTLFLATDMTQVDGVHGWVLSTVGARYHTEYGIEDVAPSALIQGF
jgi:hypothetical protein